MYCRCCEHYEEARYLIDGVPTCESCVAEMMAVPYEQLPDWAITGEGIKRLHE